MTLFVNLKEMPLALPDRLPAELANFSTFVIWLSDFLVSNEVGFTDHFR